MNDRLSWQRLLWLSRCDVLRNQRSWLIGAGAAALIALLVSLLSAYNGNVGDTFYRIFFIAALFALGTIATSQSFVDLHGRTTNTAFLMLPASALEKTLVRLVLTTVGVFVSLLVLTTVLSWLFEGINALLFDVRRETFVPFDSLAWAMLPHYLVAQSLFFLGAAWFRKLHYVKTVGAALLIVHGLSAIAAGVGWLVFGPASWGFGVRFGGDFDASFEWLGDTAKIFYYLVLPVFCWFVAWLRVTEAQVSHGV